MLGREREPSRRGEIENFGLAWNLEHHGAEMRRGKSFEAGPQRIGRIGRAHQEKKTWIQAELLEPGGIKLALLERGIILPDPKEMSLRFMLQQKMQRKCSKTARGAAR